MILVIGTDVQPDPLAQRIVQHLIARAPARPLAVSRSAPGGTDDLANRGVAVREFDYGRPASLHEAFRGIECIVLAPLPGALPERLLRQRQIFRAAAAAGVARVIQVSPLHADTPAGLASARREREAALADSGVVHVLLRTVPAIDDLLPLIEAALADGVLRLSAGDGALSLVSRDELARAIAAAALAPRLGKREHLLTGQSALTWEQIAARIARVGGRPLRYEAEAAADIPAGLFAAMATGRLAAITTDFAALVGHPPKSLDCLIHEHFAPRRPA